MLLFGGFLFVGILAGLFIAGLGYLSHHKSTHQNIASLKTSTNTTANTDTTAIKTHSKATKKLEKKAPHPHYDFYTILPSRKIDSPDNSTEATKAALQEEYILQVASVNKFQDADRLRAQLLLLGFEVFINKSRSGNMTWHRVNIGPFKSLKEAEQKQDALRKNEINSMLLKRSKA